ncbi:HK97-gp10 family putative phage morphogenesis protein [Acidovorax sp. Root568]|uniref:HK97-gp10 family putative phage morphogenesis protein n=1 Tax=Acidovorax sp. Root568 TaxID=1736565 RepID=UPI00138F4402|nr:HK97-gp10 family putative phage morphogenesis protein [Acidovorax sp. Root568]
MSIRMGVDRFKEQLRAELGVLQRATRPAAQAGVQIIYDRARINAPVSAEEHYFTIRGKKYGPYAPGNLRDAIYQVFSKEKSYKDVSTYHVSWNKDEAPYGFMVHNGTSRAPADPFVFRAVVETRAEVREAIKARYIEEVTKK